MNAHLSGAIWGSGVLPIGLAVLVAWCMPFWWRWARAEIKFLLEHAKRIPEIHKQAIGRWKSR